MYLSRRCVRVQLAYPEDFANRDDDKFNYRYRGTWCTSVSKNSQISDKKMMVMM